MVKIPRIAPGGSQIDTRSPQVRKTQPSLEGKGLQVIGGAVENVADVLYKKFDEARNLLESSEAGLLAKEELSKTILEEKTAVNEESGRLKTGKPGSGDFDASKERITSLREQVKGIFSNKDNEAKFMQQFDLLAAGATTTIAKNFRANMVSSGKAVVLKRVDDRIADYAITQDKKHLKDIENIISESEVAGFYNAEQAFKLKRTAIQNAKYQSFLHEFMGDPDGAEKKLKNNAYGLDVENKKQAISQLSELRRQLREDMNNNAQDATLQLFEGTLTLDKIDTLEASPDKREAIGKKDANSLRRALIKQVKYDAEFLATNNDKASSMLNMIDKFIDSEIDRTNFRQILTDVYSDGILTKEESAYLSNVRDNLEDLKWNKEYNGIRNAFGQVKVWFQGKFKGTPKDKKVIATAMRDLLDKFQAGEQDTAVSDVLSDNLKLLLKDVVPDFSKLPKEGKVFSDENGVTVRVFQDGSHKVE